MFTFWLVVVEFICVQSAWLGEKVHRENKTQLYLCNSANITSDSSKGLVTLTYLSRSSKVALLF